MFCRAVNGLLLLVVPLLTSAESAYAKEPLKETACFFMLGTGDGDAEPVRVPDLHVLNPRADQPKFVVELEGGAVLESVICRRSRPEFSLKDGRVLSAGFSFYVTSGDSENKSEIILTLERTEVGHRVRHIDGRKLTKKEERALILVIDALNVEQSRIKSEDESGES